MMIESEVNEDYIEDMFMNNGSQAANNDDKREDFSLNFTVTSRDGRGREKEPSDWNNILALATKQLRKFSEWGTQLNHNKNQKIDLFDSIVKEAKLFNPTDIEESEIEAIKIEIQRKDYQLYDKVICKSCSQNKNLQNQMKEKIFLIQKVMEKRTRQVENLSQQIELYSLQNLKEKLLYETQINILKDTIKALDEQILGFKAQKTNFQKTNLFNKTKNSQAQYKHDFQKSKGLSAAKNSTHSSQLMVRNDSFIYIDPVETNVEEWIKYFEGLRKKYKKMLKTNLEDIENKLQKQSKQQFFIYNLKGILKHFYAIRQFTITLEPEHNKSPLKQRKLLNTGQSVEKCQFLFKEQIQKLEREIMKLQKKNQCEVKQKCHYQEVNIRLRDDILELNQRVRGVEKEHSGCKQKIFYFKEDRQKMLQQMAVKQSNYEKMYQNFCKLLKKNEIVEKKIKNIEEQDKIIQIRNNLDNKRNQKAVIFRNQDRSYKKEINNYETRNRRVSSALGNY